MDPVGGVGLFCVADCDMTGGKNAAESGGVFPGGPTSFGVGMGMGTYGSGGGIGISFGAPIGGGRKNMDKPAKLWKEITLSKGSVN